MPQRVLTLPSLSVGVAFAECSCTLLTGQARKDGFIDYWIMPPQDPLNLAFVTSLFRLLQKLALLGTRDNKGGFALVFRLLIAGPVQHFRSAIFLAWQDTVATDLCKRKGFSCEVWIRHVWVSSTLCLFPPEGKERENIF